MTGMLEPWPLLTMAWETGQAPFWRLVSSSQLCNLGDPVATSLSPNNNMGRNMITFSCLFPFLLIDKVVMLWMKLVWGWEQICYWSICFKLWNSQSLVAELAGSAAKDTRLSVSCVLLNISYFLRIHHKDHLTVPSGFCILLPAWTDR